MATNDPAASEPRRPQLSVEEAELFASKIRPSWELIDDSMRNDLAADLAAPAPQSGPPDTIIDGVPTLSIGAAPDDVAASTMRLESDPLPTLALDPLARAALARPAAALVQAPPAGAPSKVMLTVADPASSPAPERRPPPPRGGKTRVGLGDDPAKVAKVAPAAAPTASAPSSRRAVRAAPAAPTSGRSAPSISIAEDDIDIPVTGASSGLMLKLGLGAVGLMALLGIGYLVISSSKKPAGAAPTTTAVATAPTAPTAPLRPPPPLIPAEPAVSASAAATASTAPSAVPKATAAPQDPPPQKTTPVAVAEPKKPPKSASTPAPPPKKSGGGIIRETPF